jgi:hypothetical protein
MPVPVSKVLCAGLAALVARLTFVAEQTRGRLSSMTALVSGLTFVALQTRRRRRERRGHWNGEPSRHHRRRNQ